MDKIKRIWKKALEFEKEDKNLLKEYFKKEKENLLSDIFKKIDKLNNFWKEIYWNDEILKSIYYLFSKIDDYYYITNRGCIYYVDSDLDKENDVLVDFSKLKIDSIYNFDWEKSKIVKTILKVFHFFWEEIEI